MRRTALATLVLATAAALAGCSATAVEAADVEDQVSTQLEAEVGEEPDKVECPEDLDAEVGATMTCVLTEGEDTLDVDVEVTEVDGSDVSFDIRVADEVN